MFLPATLATGTKVCPTAVDIPTAETAYICYAWPQSAGRSGVRVFAIDPQGQPYSMSNQASTFNGTTAMPVFDSAFNAAGTWNTYIDDAGAGQSAAQNWVPTG